MLKNPKPFPSKFWTTTFYDVGHLLVFLFFLESSRCPLAIVAINCIEWRSYPLIHSVNKLSEKIKKLDTMTLANGTYFIRFYLKCDVLSNWKWLVTLDDDVFSFLRSKLEYNLEWNSKIKTSNSFIKQLVGNIHMVWVIYRGGSNIQKFHFIRWWYELCALAFGVILALTLSNNIFVLHPKNNNRRNSSVDFIHIWIQFAMAINILAFCHISFASDKCSAL